jgi:hypothetical protein
MQIRARYHINPQPASPPPSGYPASFHLDDPQAYVKYGHLVFPGTAQRGDNYWTGEIITQTWYQAETGRIPISGAGYGGKFAGEGFEGIWLDMSEIVRPTRDGIHGRETISTQVDLGGGLNRLSFDNAGNLLSAPPPALSLPIPILFNCLPIPLPGRGAIRALAAAAAHLDTLAMLSPQDYAEELAPQSAWLAPRLSAETYDQVPTGWIPRYVEIEEDPSLVLALAEKVGQRWPDAVVGARLPLEQDSPATAQAWVEAGLRVIHLYADEIGQDASGRHLPQALQEVHNGLVKAALRDRVTLVASGGIAAAEHVAKSIACGADLTAIDFALQIAWGCALWADKGRCPVETAPLDPVWGAQRVVNLMNAWRDQLLEALGAMGLREVRRLRGEVGRIILNTSEAHAFREILGGAMPLARYPKLPHFETGEGDFRWPQALLLSSQEQARTGRPPAGCVSTGVGFRKVALTGWPLNSSWSMTPARRRLPIRFNSTCPCPSTGLIQAGHILNCLCPGMVPACLMAASARRSCWPGRERPNIWGPLPPPGKVATQMYWSLMPVISSHRWLQVCLG